MQLRSLQHLKRHAVPGRAERFLESVNAIRALYPYSSRTFTLDKVENLYLIVQHQALAGFCEVVLENTDIMAPRAIHLRLRELHIATSAQRQGIGSEILRRLIGHEVPIEMVVANANHNMHKLVRRFHHKVKHVGSDASSIVISAKPFPFS